MTTAPAPRRRRARGRRRSPPAAALAAARRVRAAVPVRPARLGDADRAAARGHACWAMTRGCAAPRRSRCRRVGVAAGARRGARWRSSLLGAGARRAARRGRRRRGCSCPTAGTSSPPASPRGSARPGDRPSPYRGGDAWVRDDDPARRHAARRDRRAAGVLAARSAASSRSPRAGGDDADDALRRPVIESRRDARRAARRAVRAAARARSCSPTASAPRQIARRGDARLRRDARRRRARRRAIDADAPWIDLQKIAEDVANSGHRRLHLGPQLRPARLAARRPRAAADQGAERRPTGRPRCSTTFDGARVARTTPASPPFEPDGETDRQHPQWLQTIHVSVRGLRSAQFVRAGRRSRHSTPRAPVRRRRRHVRDAARPAAARRDLQRGGLHAAPDAGAARARRHRLPEPRARSG